MVSRVKFHILMRSSTMIWSRNIMCGTAPSFVWYIQHLVQDRDLVQHHDLEPQEAQSWQQQNIEDTKKKYDSFFDRFVVVKNGWKIWNKVLKRNTQNLKHFYRPTCFFNVLKYDMFLSLCHRPLLVVFENNCCLMEEDDARFAPFFWTKNQRETCCLCQSETFPKW